MGSSWLETLASIAVWLTMATIATDIFVLITYAFAIPRNSINVTKCLVPNHPEKIELSIFSKLIKKDD
jgi:hypothetical protein